MKLYSAKFGEEFWTSEECCGGIAWICSRDLTFTRGFSHTSSFYRDFPQMSSHFHTSARTTERKLHHFILKVRLCLGSLSLHVIRLDWLIFEVSSTLVETVLQKL